MSILEKFIEISETFGWDEAVGYISSNTTDAILDSMVCDYHIGYAFCENDDVDGGRCFKIRSKAISDIIEYLQGECSVDN